MHEYEKGSKLPTGFISPRNKSEVKKNKLFPNSYCWKCTEVEWCLCQTRKENCKNSKTM